MHAVFDAIFNDGPLVASVDVTFFTPGGGTPSEENAFDAHTDQNLHDVRQNLASCSSYQGVLHIWPSGAGCSTTAVWPRSHNAVWREMMSDPIFNASGAAGYHYSQINWISNRTKARELAMRWSREARLCAVPAGALLLWNSRTVHTGWKGGPRLAQTICLQPESQRPRKEQLAKMRLAVLGLPSAHWATHAVQHDLAKNSKGFFSKADTADEPSNLDAAADHDSIRLPLRAALKPAVLRDDADLEALSNLVDVEFYNNGMWIPTEGAEEILEASVKDEFKCFL